MIRELDRWALDAAASAVAAWGRNGFKGFVSVNLSGQSLADDGLPAAAGRALARHGAAAGSIMLEVTETAAIRDLEGSRDVLGALKALGFRLALDDFGKRLLLARLPATAARRTHQDRSPVHRERGAPDRRPAPDPRAGDLRPRPAAGRGGRGDRDRRAARLAQRAGIRWGQGFLYGRPAPLTEPPTALRVPASGAPGTGRRGAAPPERRLRERSRHRQTEHAPGDDLPGLTSRTKRDVSHTLSLWGVAGDRIDPRRGRRKPLRTSREHLSPGG